VVVVSEKIDQKRLGNDFDGVAINGNPIDEDVLKKAGIDRAELFIAATDDDNKNVVAIQVAKEVHHVPLVLARIQDPERDKFYLELGLSTICPTTTGINQILSLIQKYAFAALNAHIDPDLAGIRPPEGWIGKTMAELAVPANRRLIGMVRSGRVSGFDRNRTIAGDDTLIFVRKRNL
jgi:trk system potassium uptake protein TrkA